MKTAVAIAGLLFSIVAVDARAADCASAAIAYANRCSPSAGTCTSKEFEEAKTNFFWASKRDAGAVKRFRDVFDHCDSTNDVVKKNYYSAILAQTHNMRALCTIAYCWNSGLLTGYLQAENSFGHLYKGQTAATPQPPSRLCGTEQQCADLYRAIREMRR
jgi:hypothetical protein